MRTARVQADFVRQLTAVLLALACALVSSCESSPAAPLAGRDAKLSERAMLIVSVGSAVTETVFALGAGGQIAGVDTSSVFPEAATKLPQIGYQRTLAAEGILALGPTIILASSEAGPPSVLEQIRNAGVRLEIVPSEPSITGVKARISRVAELLGRDPSKLLSELDADLARASALARQANTRPKVLVLYTRGSNTLHVFGKGTAAETMISLAGGENAVTAFEGMKPLTAEALVHAAPDIIVVPSRGLASLGGVDALLGVPGVAETPAGKAKRIIAIDDLLLLGFGPRTGKAAIELFEKIHADLGKETK